MEKDCVDWQLLSVQAPKVRIHRILVSYGNVLYLFALGQNESGHQ